MPRAAPAARVLRRGAPQRRHNFFLGSGRKGRPHATATRFCGTVAERTRNRGRRGAAGPPPAPWPPWPPPRRPLSRAEPPLWRKNREGEEQKWLGFWGGRRLGAFYTTDFRSQPSDPNGWIRFDATELGQIEPRRVCHFPAQAQVAAWDAARGSLLGPVLAIGPRKMREQKQKKRPRYWARWAATALFPGRERQQPRGPRGTRASPRPKWLFTQ